MNTPDEAAEVAAEYLPHSMDCEPQPEDDCSCWQPRVALMRAALETAHPILLSHELEQTRLAHIDAVVNAETVDRLEGSQSAAWLEGMNHVLTWLALQQFSEAMAKDNPHGRKA